MNNIHIQPSVALGIFLFSACFFAVAYVLISLVPLLVYQIIFGLLALILYVNILKLFVYELCSLDNTRMTERFYYFLLYVITAAIIALPYLTEEVQLYSSPTLRTIIIVFAALLLAKYFIYMILGPVQDIVYRLRHRMYFDNIVYEPLVSVVIPAWNEGVGITHTLDSLMKSTYRRFEIVVINDGSTDNSDQIIRKYISNHSLGKNNVIPITYRYQENTGKGGALNHALTLAKGDIILSIDADCVVDTGAIGAFVETFKDPKIMAAVGNVKIGNQNSSIGIVQYLEFLFSFYFKRAESLLGSIYIIGGAAGAFRKEVFEKLGGYSTNNITEDIELTVRIRDAGMSVGYVPDAVVFTEGASDLRGLKKQRLRWKTGRFQTFFQYRHMFFSLRKRHNKFLTWFTLPLSLIQEVQLLLEIPFILFLYAYSVLNSDFISFFTGVVVVGMMFVVQLLFYEKSARRLSFVLLAPIGWLLFYIATYVEAYALLKTIGLFIVRKKVAWQQWERKGLAPLVKTGHNV